MAIDNAVPTSLSDCICGYFMFSPLLRVVFEILSVVTGHYISNILKTCNMRRVIISCFHRSQKQFRDDGEGEAEAKLIPATPQIRLVV